jgi:hypothetical protein
VRRSQSWLQHDITPTVRSTRVICTAHATAAGWGICTGPSGHWAVSEVATLNKRFGSDDPTRAVDIYTALGCVQLWQAEPALSRLWVSAPIPRAHDSLYEADETWTHPVL